jgi:glucose/arabinose dehydrogenase
VPGGLKRGGRVAVAVVALVGLATPAATAGLGGASERQPRVGDGRGGIAKRKIGTFAAPTYVARAPGTSGFLYVTEQRGTVRVVDRGSVRRRPFLDIRGRVSCCGERGLLSIAFDPRYGSNRLLYAYYTNREGNLQIDEFRAASGTRVAPSSRRRVLVVPHPGHSNHNGGQLQFGPDGYLYAATGDGGGGGDPKENAQRRSTLLGKLLRIDPHRAGRRAYRAPPGNPFVGKRGRNEIYALGLRNPYRFSFDRGRILIGDVGQDRFEEVDFEGRRALRGANFGWDHLEGTHRFDYPGDNEAPAPRRRYQPPIFEYSHRGNRCAIIGGYVVRDPKLTSLRGRYLYADACAGRLRSFVPHRRRGRRDRGLGIRLRAPSSFGEGAGRTIYVASLSGPVYKLIGR